MSMTLGLQAFLLDREARRLTPATLTFYTEQISPFVAWLVEQGKTEVGDVRAGDIRAYLISLEKRGLAGRSQHAAARALRAMFNFLVDEEWLAVSPMARVAMPRVEQKILDALTQEQVRALVAACQQVRDEAILLCLVDTGCRASELVAWNFGDVDMKTGTVTLRVTKGNKARQVYLGARSRKVLLRHFMSRKETGKHDPIWVSSNTGERLTRFGLLQILKRIGKRAGVSCTPHTFRRTFAIWSLRNGMNIYVLQRLMGHSDLSTLQRYLKLVESDGAQAAKEYGVIDSLL